MLVVGDNRWIYLFQYKTAGGDRRFSTKIMCFFVSYSSEILNMSYLKNFTIVQCLNCTCLVQCALLGDAHCCVFSKKQKIFPGIFDTNLPSWYRPYVNFNIYNWKTLKNLILCSRRSLGTDSAVSVDEVLSKPLQWKSLIKFTQALCSPLMHSAKIRLVEFWGSALVWYLFSLEKESIESARSTHPLAWRKNMWHKNQVAFVCWKQCLRPWKGKNPPSAVIHNMFL